MFNRATNLSNPLKSKAENKPTNSSTIRPSKRARNPTSDILQQTHFQAEMVIFSQSLTNIDLQPLTKAFLLAEMIKFTGNFTELYPNLTSSKISGLDKLINDLYNIFLQHSAEIEKYFYHASRNSHYYTSVCLMIKILASLKKNLRYRMDTKHVYGFQLDS